MDTQSYTTTEAAAALGVCQRTVIRWIRSGRLTGASLRLGSRRLGYRIPNTALALLGEMQDEALSKRLSA